MSSGAASGTSGAVLCALVKDLVTTEDARRSSLDSRAVAVVTGSGALVTLLLALASATKSGDNPTIVPGAEVWLTAAAVAFVMSGAAAIATFAPRSYFPYDVARLSGQFAAMWRDSEDAARLRELSERLEQLRQLQDANNGKGLLLLMAVALQFVGLGVVAWLALTALWAW